MRILLLLDHRENRRLLQQLLGSRYDVVVLPSDGSDPAEHLDQPCDLIVVDGVALSRLREALHARREAEKPLFLPVLLVTTRSDLRIENSDLWRSIDDVVFVPVIRNELHARVEILLRARRYSRESEQRYFSLAEASPIGVAIVQEDRIVYCNRRCREIMERAETDVPLIAASNGEDRPAAFEHELVREDGHSLWLEIRTTSVAYRGGAARIVIVTDITGRKEAEAELVRAKEAAEEMGRLKASFLTNMSHEIRTPLTSIIGFADVLAGELAGERADLLRMIRSSGIRLLDTLTSVLDFAQLDSGAITLHPAFHNVSQIVRGVTERFEAEASSRGLRLEVDVPPEPVEAQIDAACLDRIVHNLVSNAVKFTHSGGVNVRLERAPDAVLLRVADTGAGIDEQFLPQIFQEFRQESQGLARSHEGSGLGLAITWKLVDLLGGTIDVRTRKGEGSTFEVRLPLPKGSGDASSTS